MRVPIMFDFIGKQLQCVFQNVLLSLYQTNPATENKLSLVAKAVNYNRKCEQSHTATLFIQLMQCS